MAKHWPEVLKGLLAEEETLQAEVESAQQRLTRVRSIIQEYKSLHGDKAVEITAQVRRLNYPKASAVILSKAERPLRVQEILTRLRRSGQPIVTADPYRTLYKVLRDRPDMFANQRGRWTLRKGALAEVADIEWPVGALPDAGPFGMQFEEEDHDQKGHDSRARRSASSARESRK